MNNFIVMQGSTYEEEKSLGIVWSPQLDKAGKVPHSWLRMKEVKKYDRIFHYVKGYIKAISIAKEDCKDGNKPQSMKNHSNWNDAGYIVNLEYRELEVPINIREYLEVIAPSFPIKYSAFQKDGGGNQGYLFPCNDELAIKLLECITTKNIYTSGDYVRGEEQNSLITIIAETESETLMKIRIGQQQFRKLLIPLWNNQCPLCGIDMSAVLRASHSKPWKDSSNEERLDPYNGVLLCANHDALYDRGLITFDSNGKIYISRRITKADYPKYGLKEGIQIHTHPKNEIYFKWHKQNIFKE